jgi:hypothetical protein
MWIKAEGEHRSCLLKNLEILLILGTPKDAYEFNCNYGLKCILLVTIIWKLKGHLW